MSSTVLYGQPPKLTFPLMEQPAIGIVLAFTAGTMDGWAHLKANTFATVQSGNVITIGSALAEGQWKLLSVALISVVCFGIGSAVAGAVMATRLSKRTSFTGEILFIEAALLLALTMVMWQTNIDAGYIAHGVSFVAGMQGNAFHKERGRLYGNVAVTMVVQMAFNSVVQSLLTKKDPDGDGDILHSGFFFWILLAFAGGGAAGALSTDAWDGWALLMPAACLAALGTIAVRRSLDENPDPT